MGRRIVVCRSVTHNCTIYSIDILRCCRHCEVPYESRRDLLKVQTVALMHAFFLAMTIWPEVQRRAQHEIDSLTKGERLPDYADREHLPNMNALLMEVHRWNPVAPIGEVLVLVSHI